MYYKLNSSQYVVFFSKARRIISLSRMRHFWRFLHPPTKKTDGSERKTKSTIKFLSFPPTPHFLFLSRVSPPNKSFLHSSGSLYSFTRAKKKRSLIFTHSSGVSRTPTSSTLLRVAGQTRRIARELHPKYIRVERLTHASRKFRLNHHGTNALLSSSIGAFYVRFDPPTTAPSGTLEKYTKNDDDNYAKWSSRRGFFRSGAIGISKVFVNELAIGFRKLRKVLAGQSRLPWHAR